MVKKFLFMPLLCFSVAFFVQCTDNLADYSDDNVMLKKGPGSGGPGGGGGEEPETAGNNLSFPVIKADFFSITPISSQDFSFTVPYTGTYVGLTSEEIAYLTANGPWYPQKTDGNVWQADNAEAGGGIEVDYVDWGDVLESVYPSVRRPTRIEVTLYALTDNPQSETEETMIGYTMAVLEFPSSPDEQQGTNTVTYDSKYATIVSEEPKLVIQYFPDGIPADLTWSTNGYWYSGITDILPDNIIPISFGPELNVGGKYIYGASSGGWKPMDQGIYRLTFYIPELSEISLAGAVIGNFSNGFTGALEGTASSPQIDVPNNLTYDDVTVIAKGGGGRR